MKYRIIIIALLLFCGSNLLAQGRFGGPGEGPRERIKAAKKKFLTQELALSAEQEKTFWPVYDDFEAEMEENHNKMKELRRGFNAKSDAQLKEDLWQFFKYKEDETAIEKKYFEKFQKVITIRQIAVLYQSEQKFKRILMETIRQNRN